MLELPTDRPRPAKQTQHGAVVSVRIPGELQARVESLAQNAETTPIMVVHSALALLLSRLSGVDDITIGVPRAGRSHRSLDGLVGMFVDTLVLRTLVGPDESFSSLLDQVRHTSLEAFDHTAVSFGQVVEALDPVRSTAHTPLFQVMLAYQNMTRAQLDLPGLTVETVEPGNDAAIYDLMLMLTAHHGQHDEPTGMTLRLTYATDLFGPASMQRMAHQFDPCARHCHHRCGESPWPTGPARRPTNGARCCSAGTTPAVPRRRAAPWSTRSTPRSPPPPRPRALVLDDGATVSYRDFDRRVNRLARWLIAEGAGPETVVAVACRRSLDLVTALYAVLKAGAAFLPIDPAQPAARTTQVLDAARPLQRTDHVRRLRRPAERIRRHSDRRPGSGRAV